MLCELRCLPAPAKLNLFLHVTGRRPDGYHLLETVFELIDLADTIDLVRLPGKQIRLRENLAGVKPADHLCVRAAQLLQDFCQVDQGVEIGLRKVIPVGGGLGGGSSNAATVLLGLNRLWGLNLATADLARLGLQLGADVPVFVHGHPAFGKGVGEDLLPLPLPPQWYVVVQPPVEVPTGRIFTSPELTRDTKPLKITGFSLDGRAGAGKANLPGRVPDVIDAAIKGGRNDLQAVTEALFPEVGQALGQLRDVVSMAAAGFGQNAVVRMSGSGACVFVTVNDSAAGAAVVRRLRERGRQAVRAWVVKSLPRHPLIKAD